MKSLKDYRKLIRLFLDPDERESFPGANKSSSLMAIAVGLFAAVGGFLYGYDTGLVNGLLEMRYVQNKFGTGGAFTADQTSLITAVLSLGTFFGALSAPMISDRFGRRFAIILCTTVIFNIGTTIQVCSTSIPLLCTGRAINGVAVGLISAVVPLYQAEASPKWVRGAIVSTYQWAITWGLLVASAVSQGTHSIDSSASYRIPISLQYSWSLILGIGMWLLPESPRFYVKNDKIKEAARALSILRRLPQDDPGLIEELVEIKANHDYELSFGKSSFIDCFRSGGGRHKQGLRMITGILLQAFQQCSGINFIFYYGVNFFARTGVDKSYLISFTTYAVNVGATIPGIVLVEYIGRRRLLLFGGLGMAVSNIIIGIVGCTTNSVVANKVMIGFTCTFIASFAASWGPVVWVVVGEIYSLAIRGKAIAMTAATNWLVNFAFAYATPYLVDTGAHTTAWGTKIFFMWGGFNFLGVIFVYFTVYETKGLRLEEVDLLYTNCKSAITSINFKPKVHLTFPGNENDDTNDFGNKEETNECNESLGYNLGYDLNLLPRGNRSPPSITSLSSHESNDRRNYNDYINRLSSFGTNGTSPPTSEDSDIKLKNQISEFNQNIESNQNNENKIEHELQHGNENINENTSIRDSTTQQNILTPGILGFFINEPPEFDSSDESTIDG